MANKDFSDAQFHAALKRNGMTIVGFMGYVNIGGGRSVSMLNAGTTRYRTILAYLLEQQAKYVTSAQP